MNQLANGIMGEDQQVGTHNVEINDDDAPIMILEMVPDDGEDDEYRQRMIHTSDSSYASCEALMQQLRDHDPGLTRLELDDGVMTELFFHNPGCVRDFLDALQSLPPHIQSVSVSGEFLASVAEIWNVHFPLDGDDNNHEDDEQEFDSLFFSAVGKLPGLTALEIQEVIDFDGFTVSMDVLKQLLHQATHLQSLSLRFVELDSTTGRNGVDMLDSSLASQLSASVHEHNSDWTLYEAFRGHPSLREVTFAQLRLAGGLTLDSLVQGLAQVPHLTTAKIHMAIQRQQHRRNIDLEDDNHSHVHDSGAQARLAPICQSQTLQTLELSSLGILDESRMLRGLHHNTVLKTLFLGHMELSFAGWAELAHMLQVGGHPSKISLKCLKLDSMMGLDDDTMRVLMHSLINNKPNITPTLQELKLYNVLGMGKESWCAVAQMLEGNRSLRVLTLENCQGMNDDAAVSVADALQYNMTLKRLELQVFSGGLVQFSHKVGQQAFLEVLRDGRNITLEYLYTQAKGEMEAQLDLYLKLNRTGLRYYALEKEADEAELNAPALFWKRLELYKNDIDVIFYVTSVNPMLVLSRLWTP